MPMTNNHEIPGGVYPTMVTPYTRDNALDVAAVHALASYYAQQGCTGIFAVCQSSEMFCLSLKERLTLAQETLAAVREGGHNLCVVASGHTADSPAAQAEELTAMHETGADAVVWVSNRLDLHNDGDTVWLRNAEWLLARLPADMKLGIYECPYPYKRLLSPEILKWCAQTGRFTFIKDTCCDPAMLAQRLAILSGTPVKLFNANAQTLLYSLQHGAAGYSGVMANFHAHLYVRLCNQFSQPNFPAEQLQSLLSICAFTESLHYPSTAKFHLAQSGVPMLPFSRACDEKGLTAYETMCIRQMALLTRTMEQQLFPGLL